LEHYLLLGDVDILSLELVPHIKRHGVVEYFFLDPRNDDSSFKLTSYRENLYVAFGTMNPVKILLPVHRELPLKGLEWTYVKMMRIN